MQQLIRDFVIFSIAGCLVASGTLVGQSKNELRRKYGEPISETYTVRPGISVTATYATSGRITELLISPQTTEYIKSRGKTLSQDSVKAIIDELVPSSVRGKYLIGTFLNVECLPENDCAGSSESYEKVTIYYNSAAKGSCTLPSSTGRSDRTLLDTTTARKMAVTGNFINRRGVLIRPLPLRGWTPPGLQWAI